MQILDTLGSKRKEIEAHIVKPEANLERARRDLSAILAVAAVFSAEGPLPKAYMNLSKLFLRLALPRLCKTACKIRQPRLIDYLSLTNGGSIATSEDAASGQRTAEGGYLPLRAKLNADPPARVLRGTAIISAEPESLASMAFGRIVTVVMRESGF